MFAAIRGILPYQDGKAVIFMKFWITFTASLLVSAVILSVVPAQGEAAIYDDVLRLRVIAESDSEADQTRKLRVRDAVLDASCALFGDCTNAEEAEKRAAAAADTIRRIAEETVREYGGESAVSVTVGRERYPRREYGGWILPAGTYRSLRITLGEGAGHNWWCVLYPGLCVRYADAGDSVAAGLTPAEYQLVTGQKTRGARIRFRLFELLAELADGLRGAREG